MIRTSLILASASLLALTACVDPNAYSDPNARTKTGIAAGALAGAAIGATASNSKPEKALLGAVLGGVIGGTIGAQLDAQAAELRAQMSPGVSVTNYGDYLVVNMPQDLLFAVDSAALSGSIVGDLRDVAGSLLRYPNSRIEVVGHTDNTGNASYNQDLSQRRANAVTSVLIQNGVPSGRVAAYGRGENSPVASNLTPDGRAQNRRVEIFIRPTN